MGIPPAAALHMLNQAELENGRLRAEIERLQARLDDGPAVTDLLHEARAEIERLRRHEQRLTRELTAGNALNHHLAKSCSTLSAEIERLRVENRDLRVASPEAGKR